jgi:plasmid maintenance system killer protein
MSIRSFSHKGLYKLFMDDDPSEVAAKDAKKILRLLNVLSSAKSKRDLHFPGSGFHPLEPSRDCRYALKVDKRFRITIPNYL